MRWIIATSLLLALMGLLVWLRRRAPPLASGPEFRIDFDDTMIAITDNLGERHEILWSDLEKVAIRTTDDGPTGADIFWGLQTASAERVLVFPDGAAGERELLDAFAKRLEGFNYGEVMHAMGTTSNGLFVVWQRGQSSAPPIDPADV
jgi:hypothetical protein